MGVYLEKVKEPLDIPDAFKSIVGDFEAYRFYDDFEGEPKEYSVYKLVSDRGAFVLKKSEDEEYHNAEVKHYGLLAGLPVPDFFGAADGYVLTGFVEGEDLKNATDEGVKAAAESLVLIMNAYPMGRDYETERYNTYLKRLEKRADRLEKEPELKKAFRIFQKRQESIPLTLSNSDLLPINVIFDGRKATVIDWEFGGFMPYTLDIVRFFAHAHGSQPFKMTDAQKRFFVDAVYSGLDVKPEREVYDRDIMLGLFNEYIEILEWYFGDENVERGDTFREYYALAKEYSERINALPTEA